MAWGVVPNKPVAFTLVDMPPAALDGVPHNKGQYKGRPLTVVKHTQDTFELLASRGLVLPSPIERYGYPGRFDPLENQRQTADFFTRHRKCFCLNGLGTGKTLSSTWGMDYMLEQGAVRRILVVCPLSIMQMVWERELFTTLPHRHFALVRGSRARKIQIAEDLRFQIIVVNPESLEVIADHLPLVDLVVVDEFTKFKNYRTNRWRTLKRVTRDTRLWLLSGTPTPQSPLDAYGPYRLVNDKPMSFGQWRDLTMVQVSKFRWVPKPDADKTVAKALQPAIRFTRDECYDMPDVTINELPVELSKAQEKAIQTFKDEAAAQIGDNEVTAANAAAVLSKVLQVMGGGVYTNDDGDGHKDVAYIEAKPFFEAVETVVEQADTPVLIFAPFKSCVEAIYRHLEAAGYRVGKVTGDVPQNKRTPLFDAVNDGSLDALVAVAGTMAHGLTLTTSAYVLWALPPYSYEEYEQANGRVIRRGQGKAVTIYHLIQNALAKELFLRLKSKAHLQDAVLNLIKGA